MNGTVKTYHGDDGSNDYCNSSLDEMSSDNSENEDKEPALARRESKAVCTLRLAVFAVLVSSMITVAVTVYVNTAGGERTQFEQQFREDATKVMESLGRSLDLTLGGLDTMVVSLVSYARATNQTWPFVTVPDFGVRSEKIRGLTNAVMMNLYQYVPKHDRYLWEDYSSVHGPQWVEEVLALQEREDIYQDVIEERNATNVTYWNVIHGYDEYDKENPGEVGLDPESPGPHLPMWQTWPLIPEFPPYNWDLLSSTNNASMVSVIETHTVSLTAAYLIAYSNDTATQAENEVDADWFAGYLDPGEEPMEPVTDIYYPILKSAADNIRVGGGRAQEGVEMIPDDLGGFLAASLYWRDWLKGILPRGSNGIIAVFSNPCNPTFTYQINGESVKFLGTGDFHEDLDRFRHLPISSDLVDLHEFSDHRARIYSGVPVNTDVCPFSITLYPSTVMEKEYVTNKPAIYACAAVIIFLFTSFVFIMFDCMVEKRQKVVMTTAVQTNAIVASLFPSTVRDRLFKQAQQDEKLKKVEEDDVSELGAMPPSPDMMMMHNHAAPSKRMGKYRRKYGGGTTEYYETSRRGTMSTSQPSRPIADLFPEATVLFADLAGFTAWSSTREPSQVFILLETLYGSFDRIAKKRHVFKIETIGDCYVAVTGLPDPQKNHAVIMARFAGECRSSMKRLVRDLEMTLGPGTADLMLRSGLHSGPVTAGVLRGEKSRFQLFGDTVNTAARMESNGMPGFIHCSQKTADLITKAGKQSWLTKREDLVEAKGKGKMQTYWLEPMLSRYGGGENTESTDDFDYTAFSENGNVDFEIEFGGPITQATGPNASTPTSTNTSKRALNGPDLWESNPSTDFFALSPDDKLDRLKHWCLSMLTEMLKELQAHRQTLRLAGLEKSGNSSGLFNLSMTDLSFWNINNDTDDDVATVVTLEENLVRGEITETVHIQPYRELGDKVKPVDPETVELPPSVVSELQQFMDAIACSYRNDNAFHAFDHACHVTMATKKLIHRITHRTGAGRDLSGKATYIDSCGLSSNPLIGVALAFAALFHDVDHPGVPNAQLVKEGTAMAKRYKKSVAEQNSFDISWNLLMEPSYSNLCSFLFASLDDAKLFRQIVVNAVVATDIFDPDFKRAREVRWSRAFGDYKPVSIAKSKGVVQPPLHYNLDKLKYRAAIVLEFVVQASDVSHTMQHWSVYERWNAYLFEETSLAYLQGRAEKDPADGWFQGELWFFDNYVIPLAKKIKECEVFGSAGHEFYDCAIDNRLEWENKGKRLVEEMKNSFQHKYGKSDDSRTKSISSETTLRRVGGAGTNSESRRSSNSGRRTTFSAGTTTKYYKEASESTYEDTDEDSEGFELNRGSF